MARQRGRKSVAAQAIGQVVTLPERPRAPTELNDEEVSVWDQVVGAHPGDWISRDQVPLLIQYVRHVVGARRVAQLITQHEAGEQFDTGAYLKLLTAQQTESKQIVLLARSMRITNQSRYVPHAGGARPSPQNPKPWE